MKQEKEAIIMEQRRYVEGIKTLRREDYMRDRKLEAKEETLYKSIMRQLNRTVQHNRPFGVSVASQIGREKSSIDMRRLLKLVGRAKVNHLEVRMKRLRGEVEMETYMDASFGNVKGGRSQVSFVVGIRDEWGRKFPIYWKSRRGQRVASSTLETERSSVGPRRDFRAVTKPLQPRSGSGSRARQRQCGWERCHGEASTNP